MKNLVVLTGAGISAESGIKTFRDADGLWEGHDVMHVASAKGFQNNPKLVLDFYNQRRRQLLTVKPNKAHYNLKELETNYNVQIITQNVDDLHERAGSTNIVHLHGELLKVRSTKNKNDIIKWTKDLNNGDVCKQGSQLRPHIVWFGEMVPMLDKAIEITKRADILVVIGTSMQVYPASSLIEFVSNEVPIYFIDPKPNINRYLFNKLTVIRNSATSGTDKLLEILEV